MSRGQRIIISSEPKGRFEELYAKSGQTIYPGMIVQKDFSVSMISGRHTAKIYDRGADGDQPAGPFFVVTEILQGMVGRDMTQRIPDGEKMLCYCPVPGDELNLLLKDVSGTGDDHAIGEILMVDDDTGKLIATTGSPETEVAVLCEAFTDPTADQLGWCQWSGI